MLAVVSACNRASGVPFKSISSAAKSCRTSAKWGRFTPICHQVVAMWDDRLEIVDMVEEAQVARAVERLQPARRVAFARISLRGIAIQWRFL